MKCVNCSSTDLEIDYLKDGKEIKEKSKSCFGMISYSILIFLGLMIAPFLTIFLIILKNALKKEAEEHRVKDVDLDSNRYVVRIRCRKCGYTYTENIK